MDQLLSGLRPYTDNDLDALARLLRETQSWPSPVPPSPDEILARWQRRNVHPQQDVNVLPGRDGALVAYTQSALFKDGTPRLSFEIGVHPEQRRKGIGNALYHLVEDKARDLRVTHLTSPLVVAAGTSRPECVAFLAHRAFKREYSYWQMRLDDIAAQQPPTWPPGISVRTFGNVDRDARIWAELIVETFNEIATPSSIAAQLAEPGVSPDGYFFAVDERTGQDVGTSRARIDILGGKPVGYVGTVGVLPQYRRRGIAQALIAQTLQYLARQGMESAVLNVNDANSPARRLYGKLGWREVARTDHFWKRTDSPGW
ncbi:MAG TPA: GNAT family N-acetyltransferase [Chloroflexia bacterium]|jgi:mycothiol synthase